MTENLKIMSNHDDQTQQLIEVVSAIKELTNEIKHLVKSHDETKVDVQEHEKRIRDMEIKFPLLEDMRDNQKSIKLGLMGAVFSGAAAVVTGIILFIVGAK